MRPSVKPLFALGVAFAAGVGVTAAFVGTKPEKATVQQGMTNATPQAVATSKTEKVASLTPSSRSLDGSSASEAASPSDSDKWVDPVKQRSAAPPSHQPLPPLVFHMDDKKTHSSVEALQESEQAGNGPARQAVVAMVSPPPRPEKSELIVKPAKPEIDRHPTVAARATDRTLSSRPVTETQAHKSQAPRLTAKLHRNSEPVRGASIVEEPDDEDLAAERQARREYAMRQAYDEGMPPQFYPARRIRYAEPYDRDFDDAPREYRRRATTAPSGDVMRWLEQR
jgi:hypothetical protein